jgi:DnaJ homolog subfamily B member 4
MNLRRIHLFLFLIILGMTLKSALANRNFYSILGVAKDSSPAEIKKAYRKLALKHHPDKGGSESKFKEISEAYDILSDEKKRNVYDQHGEEGLDPRFSQEKGFNGAEPEFFTFFNTNQFPNRQSQYQRGKSFSFDQFSGSFGSSGGTSMDIGDFLRQMMMGQNGGFSPNSFQYRQSQSDMFEKPTYFVRSAPCSLQDLATGATKKFKVSYPGRNTGDEVSKIFEIKLKKGWKAGTKVKFPPVDGLPGITFVIEEKKHPFLDRQGDDLIYHCQVSSNQATNGARIRIPLPDGELIPVIVDKDDLPIQEGKLLIIHEKGMPIKGGPLRGNLHIYFSIAVPI